MFKLKKWWWLYIYSLVLFIDDEVINGVVYMLKLCSVGEEENSV